MPTNLHVVLRVAYLDFVEFEKSSMSNLPLLENRKKLNKTGEKLFYNIFYRNMIFSIYLP